MKKDEVSPIIPTATGALFFTVAERKTPPYKEDMELIEGLKTRKQSAYYQRWLAQQKQEANLVDLTPFL